ncbi:hypothetical protein [Acinetobacter rudis]|uniref:Uncharacterized protein n=1 Tax=Acinetobacter rudis CIP 110305 TaxID=421052 RepID=S3NCX1_9GAMM|nr:hypothetical protein [Acinetobacter rudis]EPF72159.1 hypothetical protein F945_02211 [Acinetobacter rudis CIP 110305]
MKKVLLVVSLSMYSIAASAAGNPVAVGDVVGRDLSVWGLGALVHIGLLASSNNIA